MIECLESSAVTQNKNKRHPIASSRTSFVTSAACKPVAEAAGGGIG